jgi:farnesyl diphosphate synthase
VCLAVLLHNRKLTPEVLKVVKDVTIPMGEFFQIQDDFLDCFGSPEQIGKVGRDIEEAKCGWLVVTALKRCSASQRKVLEENYGREEPERVARVKQVYRELDMPKVYADYEESSYRQLQALIAGQTVVPRAVFDDLLKKIYKRTK